MELDFTGLFEIAPKTRVDAQEDAGHIKHYPSSKNAPEGKIDPLKCKLEGVSLLQREADSRQEELDKARRVYSEYQENIKTSSQLQAEILKGIRNGESIYSLFLKATQAISLMTSNKLFHSQAEADLIAIYGAGLSEPEPLSIELNAAEGRLERLRAAYDREDAPDNRRRIESAIEAHEERIIQIHKLL